MQALILIGAKRGKDGARIIECLYCGLNGVELQEMADLAAKSGEYEQIGKLVNPQTTPMPISGTKTVGTTPTFPRPKELPKPKIAPKPEHMQKADDLTAKLRAERLKVSKAEQAGEKPGLPPKTETKLREDGPTLEEFTASGYKAENYPPAGFAEKDSPALKLFKESKKNPPATS